MAIIIRSKKVKITRRQLRRIIKEESQRISQSLRPLTKAEKEAQLIDDLVTFLTYRGAVTRGSPQAYAEAAEYLRTTALPKLESLK